MQRTYGDSRLVGDDESFFKQSLRNQLLELAVSHGCPAPMEVAWGYGVGAAGIQHAISRYAQCNLIYTQGILEQARLDNPTLYAALCADYIRKEGELPATPADPERVPPDYATVLRGSATPWGYSLPRIVIEIFGSEDAQRTERFINGLMLARELVTSTDSPQIYSLKLAERACSAGARVHAVLSHLFAVELLRPENCRSYLEELESQAAEHAPSVLTALRSLIPREREAMGIAVF